MVVITLDRIYKKEGVTWKVLWREWVKMSMVNMHHKSAWDLDENFKGCDYPTGFVLFIEDCVSALLQGTLQTGGWYCRTHPEFYALGRSIRDQIEEHINYRELGSFGIYSAECFIEQWVVSDIEKISHKLVTSVDLGLLNEEVKSKFGTDLGFVMDVIAHNLKIHIRDFFYQSEEAQIRIQSILKYFYLRYKNGNNK